MIIDKIGDILHTEADVICHQVNCKGVMGAGLAKQIRNQLLSEEQYRTYQEICREYGRANLGKVIRMKTDTYQVYNLFGEDIPTGSGVDTIYAALYKALVSALYYAETEHLTLAVPGMIGCGLAGGDWRIVRNHILEPIFGTRTKISLYIHWLDEENYMKAQELMQQPKKDVTAAIDNHKVYDINKITNYKFSEEKKDVTGSTKFTPTESNGTVDVTFMFDGSELNGKQYLQQRWCVIIHKERWPL